MVEKPLVRVDAEAETEDNKSGTEESAEEVCAFPEKDAEYGGGGEGGGVGDRDGEGERGVGEDCEESGGGGEVDEEGNGVLPDGEKLEPVPEGDAHFLAHR